MTQPAGSDSSSRITQTSDVGDKVTCTDGKIRKIAEKIVDNTKNEASFKFEHHKGSNAVFAKMWHCVRDIVSPYSA